MTGTLGANRHGAAVDPHQTAWYTSPEESGAGNGRPHRASKRTNIIRALIIVALIPVGMFYLFPRIYNLTATPYRLDAAVVSAGHYNPALDTIVAHEKVTLAAFDAMDKMKTSLASVQQTDATVNAELNTLIGQISGDVQATLNQANANVTDLVSSLDTLTGHINSLQAPVDGATSALDNNRATLGTILDDTRSTAAKVHSARVSAESSANDLSGK